MLPTQAVPVTPEEAAAIARRIRVEARLPRVAAIGTAMGIVCGTAAVFPFLDSRGYMADTLVGDEFGVLSFVPGWLLAGLLPLLAFYAGRLHFQTGRSSTGEIEAGLRKVRRIILWSMFASVTAFVFMLASRPRHQHADGPSWLALLYPVCFLACAAIIADVRRGLGDFDSEHQRRRRKLARGFAVQLGPTAADVATSPKDSATAADPIPVATAVPTARVLPVDSVTADEDEHFKDLRLLMTLAVVVAVALHAVRVGDGLPHAARVLEHLAVVANSLLAGSGSLSLAGDTLAGLTLLLSMMAAMLLIPCGALWIVWGILALNYGPAFRRGVTWLTIVTLALAAAASAPGWLYGPQIDEDRYAGRLARAPEVIHCLFLGLLLTRLGVRRMLERSDDADETSARP